jgi:hypothetical protein
MSTSSSHLTGLDLFKIKSKRDYTDSEDDNYAQLLFTMYIYIGDALFPLLEQAEQQNKKLYFIPDEECLQLKVSFYSIENIGLK